MSDTQNTNTLRDEHENAVIIQKTTPGNVVFKLSPVDNPNVVREIYLTSRHPSQALPINYALGIFLNEGVFTLYKKGIFTFKDPAKITQLAIKQGYFFGSESEAFTPAAVDKEASVLAILKGGNRTKILDACKEMGNEYVKMVATVHVEELTQAVILMLQNLWNVQLTVENSAV